jgi:hypothetical protein
VCQSDLGFLGYVQTGRRDMRIFFLRHAARPSMARSGAGYPAGSRPQKEDTHIPSHSRGSTSICSFEQKEQKQPVIFNYCHPGLGRYAHPCAIATFGVSIHVIRGPFLSGVRKWIPGRARNGGGVCPE